MRRLAAVLLCAWFATAVPAAEWAYPFADWEDVGDWADISPTDERGYAQFLFGTYAVWRESNPFQAFDTGIWVTIGGANWTSFSCEIPEDEGYILGMFLVDAPVDCYDGETRTIRMEFIRRAFGQGEVYPYMDIPWWLWQFQ